MFLRFCLTKMLKKTASIMYKGLLQGGKERTLGTRLKVEVRRKYVYTKRCFEKH